MDDNFDIIVTAGAVTLNALSFIARSMTFVQKRLFAQRERERDYGSSIMTGLMNSKYSIKLTNL